MILCCGEALVDFLPVEGPDRTTCFRPFNGGSIYNVAIALGRLGRRVGFFGGLSDDFFGQTLAAGLAESGVDLSAAVRSARSSTLAFVRFENGEPHYAFVDEGSAGRMLYEFDLPELGRDVTALHFGSISLIHDPAGATFEVLARSEARRRVISFDPNIRPGQITDRKAHLARIDAFLAAADIVKLSDVDLEWIAPGADANEVAASWLDQGVKLVALTRGSAGAVVYGRGVRIESRSQPVVVADTVGAGDTFMAGLLANLDDAGLLNVSAIGALAEDDIRSAVEFAMRAAAVTVSRPGANPPWATEL